MATFDILAGEHQWWKVEAYERRPVIGTGGKPVLRAADDQTGYLPVAQVLDSWARAWVEAREIAVAAHSVTIESADPLDTVAAKALELFRQTEASALRSPVGFGTTGSSVERAEPVYDESEILAWGSSSETGCSPSVG